MVLIYVGSLRDKNEMVDHPSLDVGCPTSVLTSCMLSSFASAAVLSCAKEIPTAAIPTSKEAVFASSDCKISEITNDSGYNPHHFRVRLNKIDSFEMTPHCCWKDRWTLVWHDNLNIGSNGRLNDSMDFLLYDLLQLTRGPAEGLKITLTFVPSTGCCA